MKRKKKESVYKSGWYDLMSNGRRVNRMRLRGEDAQTSNYVRMLNEIPARWVWGKQPGRPRKKK